MSENSTSDTPTEASEDSESIDRCQVPAGSITSKHDDDDSFEDKPITEFELHKENGEQNIVQENKLLSTNFTIKIENCEVEGLITYSMYQQIFKFKDNSENKESQETSNSDKLNNFEIWGVCSKLLLVSSHCH